MVFGTKRKTRQQVRVGVESLEGRVVLTTYHVANVAQLLAAISAVNNSSSTNTILLSKGRYDLPGELQIKNAGNLTIRPATTNTTVSLVGEVLNRVIDVEGGKVTLGRLSISGGGNVAQGGGVYANNADLTIQGSTVAGNTASQAGGGIFAQGGTLTVLNSTINGNQATSNSFALGGGLAAVNAGVTISGSTIADNSVDAVDQQNQNTVQAGGGAIYALGGSLDIKGSVLSNNTVLAITNGNVATGSGGAIDTTSTHRHRGQRDLPVQQRHRIQQRRDHGTGRRHRNPGRQADDHRQQVQCEHSRPLGRVRSKRRHRHREQLDDRQKTVRRYLCSGAQRVCPQALMAVHLSSVLSSTAIRSKSSRQSPHRACRKSRIVGYHGESSRPSSHRQSAATGSAIQTGAAERPGQVRQGGVRRDDQVECFDRRGGIHEITQTGAKINDRKAA